MTGWLCYADPASPDSDKFHRQTFLFLEEIRTKLVTIIGARPQFIKCAPVSAALRCEEVIVNTGQHYDRNMSGIFFEEFEIVPDYDLGIGSGTHGFQTGQMLMAIECVLQHEQPDMVVVYGDTNSTLAGALAASKLQIPIAHVEAGLRSYDRSMPEEINRVIVDHLSALLFCPSRSAGLNLRKEGITKGVFVTGDVMSDILQKTKVDPDILPKLGLKHEQYYVATVHRPSNADNPENMKSILSAFEELDYPVIFPVHPRTTGCIYRSELRNTLLVEPLGYGDMISLIALSKGVLTDSGGIQKEAYLLGVPCTTLRENTEWIETLPYWNVLAGADKDKIIQAATRKEMPCWEWNVFLYGKGRAAETIALILEEQQPCFKE